MRQAVDLAGRGRPGQPCDAPGCCRPPPAQTSQVLVRRAGVRQGVLMLFTMRGRGLEYATDLSRV